MGRSDTAGALLALEVDALLILEQRATAGARERQALDAGTDVPTRALSALAAAAIAADDCGAAMP